MSGTAIPYHTAELREWYPCGKIWAGKIFNDKLHRFKDNTFVYTSNVKEIKELQVDGRYFRLVYTMSGNVFLCWEDQKHPTKYTEEL